MDMLSTMVKSMKDSDMAQMFPSVMHNLNLYNEALELKQLKFFKDLEQLLPAIKSGTTDIYFFYSVN